MAYYDDMCEVWELVRESFHDKLSSETINLWFGTLRIVSFKGRELTMSIKSPFKYDIIKEKYLGEIKARFSKMLGFDIDIVLLLEDRDDELIAQSEKPAEEKTVGALGSTMPPYNFEYTFDNFIVGNSNKFAHAAATAVAAAPAMNYNPLFIYGPSGLGKTHLLYAITNEVKKKKRDAEIIYIKGEDFTNQLIEALARQKTAEFRNKYRSCDMLLIDDIQFIAGKVSTQIQQRQPDGIWPETDAEQIFFGGKGKKLGALAFISGREISMELARGCISELLGGEEPVSVTVDKIFAAVYRRYGISKEELLGTRRTREIAQARHISIYLIRKVTEMSLPNIGKIFGRDHTTVMSSCEAVEKRLRTDAELVMNINAMIKEVSGDTSKVGG